MGTEIGFRREGGVLEAGEVAAVLNSCRNQVHCSRERRGLPRATLALGAWDPRV